MADMHQSNLQPGARHRAPVERLTFSAWHRATAGALARERAVLFDRLADEHQETCWRDLGEQCRRHNELLRLLGARGLA